MMGVTSYECRDGSYFGDVDGWERLVTRTRTLCCWMGEPGAEWTKTEDNESLVTVPISRNDLPAGSRKGPTDDHQE